MTSTPGWLFSRTLQATDWPGLEVVHEELVEFMREAKATDGPELRTLGSVSLVKQLLAAGLLDRLKLVVCPLVLGETGVEPLFGGLPDIGFDLLSTKTLDERVMLVEYRPRAGPLTRPRPARMSQSSLARSAARGRRRFAESSKK